MKTIILFVILVGSDGSESMHEVSKHNTFLSCKVEQSKYSSLKDKIIYFCSDSLYYKKRNV